MAIPFQLKHQDAHCKARSGSVSTDHGSFETPTFMPVGTIGTVKTLSPDDLKQAGVEIMLSNTYHLYLRPGTDILKHFGGLHRLNAWDGPILTDSGGFQVYSLDDLKTISEDGVEFRSHWDGSKHLFTPEVVVDIQRAIGSDIMMVLDHLTGNPAEYQISNEAHLKTLRWARRSREHFVAGSPIYNHKQYQFGIVQGGIYDELRAASIAGLEEIGFDGYAIGGLAVGESRSVRYKVIDFCTTHMTPTLPRYLMGVGKPQDLLDAIELGVDMFDCVIPSRNGRNGSAFTYEGRLNLRNAVHKRSESPIDSECSCYCCRHFSRGYLHHMMKVDEVLVLRLLSLHNIHFYETLMRLSREAIRDDGFRGFKEAFLSRYGVAVDPETEEPSGQTG